MNLTNILMLSSLLSPAFADWALWAGICSTGLGKGGEFELNGTTTGEPCGKLAMWDGRDGENRRYVALKITISGGSETTKEMQMLRHLAEIPASRAHDYVTLLLDEFTHQGPNGLHRCLVFELMGPSVNSMVEELPQFKPRRWGMKIRYPTWMSKRILKQTLKALAFLHANGVAHGDLQPGNMLFGLRNIDSMPEEKLLQLEDENSGSISPPVRRRDGKSDKWAPRYLCIAQPLVDYTQSNKGFKIKLSDMGGAYFFTDPPRKILTPRGLRAPESILQGTFNRTLDVWSFGCLVFELIAGRPLFCVPWSDGTEDDGHLLSLNAGLGPLPNDIFEQWKRSSLYFTPERQLYNCHLGGVQEGDQPLMLEQKSMEDLFDEAKPDLDEEEGLQVKQLIRGILQYDPTKRPAPQELLSHPWFTAIVD
ncbi:serine protein kinase [Paramyrothecium foliicola]|nr:serine protein kinase [Paramyrothecium foliicola]